MVESKHACKKDRFCSNKSPQLQSQCRKVKTTETSAHFLCRFSAVNSLVIPGHIKNKSAA